MQGKQLDLPFKSVAIALIFSVLLGPIGLLYASFWGGLVLTLLALVLFFGRFGFLVLLIWFTACAFSVRAVESYNRKICKSHA
ncbi:MAG: hypothetical protein A3E85_03455 [Gammaproteobacteria bacterium RIFCSPHIGHO2_12_FULL_45_12]|nr:MAG: hypothetical protein A3E85_03455 [Gammaproteobacteria bacterium RIFCSPHIGHO2_12_FULL_45_12]